MKNILLIAALCFIAASCGKREVVVVPPSISTPSPEQLDELTDLRNLIDDLKAHSDVQDGQIKKLEKKLKRLALKAKRIEVCESGEFLRVKKGKKFFTNGSEVYNRHTGDLISGRIPEGEFVVIDSERKKVEFAVKKGKIYCQGD